VLDDPLDELAERAEAEGELQVAVLFLGHDLERIGAEFALQAIEIAPKIERSTM